MKLVIAILTMVFSIGSFAQLIDTYGGTGIQATTVVNGQAITTNLDSPFDIVIDNAGNIYFSDQPSSTVFRIDNQSGMLTNYFGNGNTGMGTSGELGPDFELGYPNYMTIDNVNEVLYVSDGYNQRIFKMDMADSSVTVVAGNGTGAYTADGNVASTSSIFSPRGLALSQDGTLYFVEAESFLIRKILQSGLLETVAGTPGSSGDVDGTLTGAYFYDPFGLEIDNSGNLYVAEPAINKIRKIDITGNLVLAYAGNGTAGSSGDGFSAVAAELYYPHDMHIDQNGDLLIADTENNKIRKIDGNTQIIITIAGTGIAGYSGDGGDPLLANLDGPIGVVSDANNNYFWAEIDNFVIRGISSCDQPSVPELNIVSATYDINGNVCPGVVEIEIESGVLNDANEWQWFEDDCAGGATPLQIGNSFNYIYNGLNSVTIAASGTGGCVSNAPCGKITIEPGDCPDIGNPLDEDVTAFSPNADGKNDFFYINDADDHPTNTVYIYNRWGDVIKTIVDYNNIERVWEGTDEVGTAVGVGTYFYIFESDNLTYQSWVNVLK